VIRVGGTPWFKAPITTKSGTERSPYVLLGGDGVTGRDTQRGRFENAQDRQQAQVEGSSSAAAGEHPTVSAARRSNERAEEAAAQRRREGR
jgi:hypothetical protein